MAKLVKLSNGIELTVKEVLTLKSDPTNAGLIVKLAGLDLTAAIAEIAVIEGGSGSDNNEAKGEKSHAELLKAFNTASNKFQKDNAEIISKGLEESLKVLNDQISKTSKTIIAHQGELVDLQDSTRKRGLSKADIMLIEESIKVKEGEIKTLGEQKADSQVRWNHASDALETIDSKGNLYAQIIAIGNDMESRLGAKYDEQYKNAGRFILTKKGISVITEPVMDKMIANFGKIVSIKIELDKKGIDRIASVEFLEPTGADGKPLAGDELVKFYAAEFVALKGISDSITKVVIDKLISAVGIVEAGHFAKFEAEKIARKALVEKQIGTELVAVVVKSAGTKSTGKTVDITELTVELPDGSTFGVGKEIAWSIKSQLMAPDELNKFVLAYCEKHGKNKDVVLPNAETKLNACYFSSADATTKMKVYKPSFSIVQGKIKSLAVETPDRVLGNGEFAAGKTFTKSKGIYSNWNHEGMVASNITKGTAPIIVVAETYGVAGIKFFGNGELLYTTK